MVHRAGHPYPVGEVVEHVGLAPVDGLDGNDHLIWGGLLPRKGQKFGDLAKGRLPGVVLGAAAGPGTAEDREGDAQPGRPLQGPPEVVGQLRSGGNVGAGDLKAGGHKVVAGAAGEVQLLQHRSGIPELLLAELGQLVQGQLNVVVAQQLQASGVFQTDPVQCFGEQIDTAAVEHRGASFESFCSS